MQNAQSEIINYLLGQSWQIGVVFVVVAGGCWLLRKSSAHWRYLLWLIVLAKCLVPPLLSVPVAVLPESPILNLSATEALPLPITATESPIAEPVEIVSSQTFEPTMAPLAVSTEPVQLAMWPSLTRDQWLGAAWMGGVAMFLCLCLFKAWRTQGRLGRTRQTANADLQTEVAELAARLGLGVVPKVWLVEGISQPFVWGLFRGGIYLPGNFEEVCQADDRRGILMHELAHVSRWDAAVNSLQVLVQVAFFFHPLVWWANRKIRQEREKCCDEVAIASLAAKPKQYGSAIVDILVNEYESSQPVPSLAVAGPIKNVEERIKTMMRPNKKFYKRPTLLAVISVLIVAAIAVPTTLTLTARAESKPEPATQAAGKTATELASLAPIKASIRRLSSERISDDGAWTERLRWRIDRSRPSLFIHGWFSEEATGNRKVGSTLEHVGGGTNKWAAAASPIDFELSITRSGQILTIKPSRTEMSDTGSKTATAEFGTRIPARAELRTSSLGEPSLLHTNKYITLWQAEAVLYGKVVKKIVYAVRIARPGKEFSGFLKQQDPVKKVEPLPQTKYTFGPVIERVIYEIASDKSAIDFDNGKLHTGPEQVANMEEFHNWLETTGIDAVAMVSSPLHGLSGFDMIAMPLDAEQWNINPAEGRKLISLGKAGTPAIMSGKGQLPATFLFKTREGGMGVLQIVGFTDKPKGVKIRYKMVQSAKPGKPLWNLLSSNTKPYNSDRFHQMRQILLGLTLYVQDQNGWPAELIDLKPYLPNDASLSLDQYIFKSPGKVLSVEGKRPILFEKTAARPDGEFVGFDDSHVEFVKDRKQLEALKVQAGLQATKQPAATFTFPVVVEPTTPSGSTAGTPSKTGHPSGTLYFRKLDKGYLLKLVSKCYGQDITETGTFNSGDRSRPRSVQKHVGFAFNFAPGENENSRFAKRRQFRKELLKTIKSDMEETLGVMVQAGGNSDLLRFNYTKDEVEGNLNVFLALKDDVSLMIQFVIQETYVSTDRKDKVRQSAKMNRLQAESLTFGPVIEREIPSAPTDGKEWLIDFDTGKIISITHDEFAKQVPTIEGANAYRRWYRKTGMDAVVHVEEPFHGLLGIELVVVPTEDTDGLNLKPDAVVNSVSGLKPGDGSILRGDTPLIYKFKTREGGMGVLQIVGFTDKPKGVKIRYKMVQQAKPGKSGTN